MASRIVLDGETRTRQQVALAKIGADFLGKKRLPMLVIDAPSALSGMHQFSARAAGIRGFSLFGRYRTFALKEDMSLDLETLDDFLEKYGKEPFLIFGFTFLIWQYLVLALEQCMVADGKNCHLRRYQNRNTKQDYRRFVVLQKCMITTEWQNRRVVFSWNVSVVIYMLLIIPVFCSGERLIFHSVILESVESFRCCRHFRKVIRDTVF